MTSEKFEALSQICRSSAKTTSEIRRKHGRNVSKPGRNEVQTLVCEMRRFSIIY